MNSTDAARIFAEVHDEWTVSTPEVVGKLTQAAEVRGADVGRCLGLDGEDALSRFDDEMDLGTVLGAKDRVRASASRAAKPRTSLVKTSCPKTPQYGRY